MAAALAAPAPAAAQDPGPETGLIAGGAVALPLGRAAGSLAPSSPPAVAAPQGFLRIRRGLGGPEGTAALTYFTPHPGAAPLGLIGPDAFLADGGHGAAIAVVLEQPMETVAPGVPAGTRIALGAGLAARRPGRTAAPADAAAGAPTRADAFAIAGRISLSGFSLAGFLAAAPGGGRGARTPDGGGGAGYDFALSYAFETGAVSVSRFRGDGADRAGGAAPGEPLDRVTVAGRYILGPGLDMTALVAFTEVAESDASGNIGTDGWALLTGFRLSF